jgi:hypothetical protein
MSTQPPAHFMDGSSGAYLQTRSSRLPTTDAILCSRGCSRQFQITEAVLKEHAGGPDKANIAASDDAEPMEDIQSSILYVSFFCSGIMDNDL